MPDENTTIVAKWSYLRTITFNSEGGSNVVDIVAFSGESISAPIAPTKTNYYLGGWYTDLSDDSTKFSFDVMPDSDITLYAKWIDNITMLTTKIILSYFLQIQKCQELK